jgi:hypothetical protein
MTMEDRSAGRRHLGASRRRTDAARRLVLEHASLDEWAAGDWPAWHRARTRRAARPGDIPLETSFYGAAPVCIFTCRPSGVTVRDPIQLPRASVTTHVSPI